MIVGPVHYTRLCVHATLYELIPVVRRVSDRATSQQVLAKRNTRQPVNDGIDTTTSEDEVWS